MTMTLSPSYPIMEGGDAPSYLAMQNVDLEHMEEHVLRREIHRCLAISKESLGRAARGIQLLESHGCDVSDVPPILLKLLRKVAAGMILPELAFELMHKPYIIDRIAECPRNQQVQLQADPKVVVLELGSDGVWDNRMRPIANLSVSETQQVFGPSGIRDEHEQKAWLSNHCRRQQVAPAMSVQFLKAKQMVRVFIGSSHRDITREELLAWAKELK